MMELEQCPSCGIPWQDELNVLERMIQQSPNAELSVLKDRAEEYYGHTEDHPQYFGMNCLYKEYRGLYDGALAIHCEGCKKDFGRFSGREIDYKRHTPEMEKNYYFNGEWE